MSNERTTFLRQWALLKALPLYPRKISVSQLWHHMEELGYEVTKRTIERDLLILVKEFPVVSDEAKPAGWSIRPNTTHHSSPINRLLSNIHPLKGPLSPIAPVETVQAIDDEAIKTLNQRFDPYGFHTPKAHHPRDFVGRLWLLKKMDDWLLNRRSSLLWLQGAPGVGKTAFMSWLAHQRRELVVASYFCQYQFQKTPEAFARDAILSWVVQLGRRVPAYCSQLIGHEYLDRTALENHTIDELFKYLIAQPLASIATSKVTRTDDQSLVLLIDAMDEAASHDSNNLLLECIVKQAKQLPHSVAIIISSRHEPWLQLQLASVDTLVLSADDYGNQQDLCQWLNNELSANLPDSQRLWISDQLMRHSEGLFLYLKLLKLDMAFYLDHPDVTPFGLDEFFSSCFRRYFPRIEDYSVKQRPLLELLLCAVEPVTEQTLCQVLGWDVYECDRVMASFGTLLHRSASEKTEGAILLNESPEQVEPSNEFKPFHKALIDWLTDANRAGLYRIIPQMGQQRWANGLLAQYQSNLDQLSSYGLKHLPRHLGMVGSHDAARDCLLDMRFIIQRAKSSVVYSQIHALCEEYQYAHTQTHLDDSLLTWQLFFRAKGHLLQKGHAQWPVERILLQLAAEQPTSSVICEAAKRYLDTHFQGFGLRSITPELEPTCHVLDEHYDGLKPLVLDKHRIVGVTREGQLRVWDAASGQRLLTMTIGELPVGLLALDENRIVVWTRGEQASLSLIDIQNDTCLLRVDNRGDIQQVCQLSGQRFIASFEHYYVGIWDFAGQLCTELKSLTHAIGHIWPLTQGFCLMDTGCVCNGDSENILLLWDERQSETLTPLHRFAAYESVKVIPLEDNQCLIYGDDSDSFHIWALNSGRLLATGQKQPKRPLTVLKGDSALHIAAIHDFDLHDDNNLLNIHIWQWCDGALTFERRVALMSENSQDAFDQISCICDSHLFENATVLLPDPLSLWSVMDGKKIADLQGNWSLGLTLADDGFFRRFDDGRLLTWTEPKYGSTGIADCVHLWDQHGQLIRSIDVESRFFNVSILNQTTFATFNCNDTLQVWDADNGDLRQTIIGLGAKIKSAQSLNNSQLLVYDEAGQLSLWQLASTTPTVEHRHASYANPQVRLFGNRILSYSRDTFSPNLWDASTGEWVAKIPAYDSAVGAFLEDVVPLSGGRFLTWGNAPLLHIYDSENGQCLATLQDHVKPYLGSTQVWLLDNDQILCRLWDYSLRVFDLQSNDFDHYYVIADRVKRAYPIGTELVLYCNTQGAVKLWHVKTHKCDSDLLENIDNIQNLLSISQNRVIVQISDQVLKLIHYGSGQVFTLDWVISHQRPQITELASHRIALWSDQLLQVWDITTSPSIQFSLSFHDNDRLIFATPLPNGHLLTQISNRHATALNIWEKDTGSLLGSKILDIHCGKCLASYAIDHRLFLRMLDEATQTEHYVSLDWNMPHHIELLALNQMTEAKDALALKKFTEQMGLKNGHWFYWNASTGSSVGISRLGNMDVHCEWYGQPIHQFLQLTDDGKLLGFSKKPIVLQLFNKNKAVSFGESKL